MSTNPSNNDLDALAARLRQLPEPAIPAGLEAKLLAAIPERDALASKPLRRRERRWLATVAAAVVLLGIFLASFTGPKPRRSPQQSRPAPQVAAQRPPTLGLYREYDAAGRVNTETVPPVAAFEWPVQVTTPITARQLPED